MTASTTSNGSVLGSAVARLVEVVEEENAVLHRQSIVSHAAFTDRKNQALRELMAAQRREGWDANAKALRPLLQSLSEALQLNARLLKHHIAAVGEVSDILVGNLRDLESDGTYTRGQSPRRWR